VSHTKNPLAHTIWELAERSALLRQTLLDYEKTMLKIADRLEEGQPAIVAARGTGIPAQRRQVTEGIQEFEAARHQLRLMLMIVARGEGASISDVGRVLGISRQLASRLAAEADKQSS
jgi:hypothetical protein